MKLGIYKNLIRKVVIGLLFLFNANIYTQTINFKDKNLEKALIELGFDTNKNSHIEFNEIEYVEELNISGRKIKTLDDLEKFKYLKILNVNNNLISDISTLYGNENLEEIYIGDNQLGPVLDLRDLPSLREVYVFRNQLKQINFVSSFPSLTALYLQENPISNLNIVNLENLESLQLFECFDLRKIELSKKAKIKQLFIIDMQITKIVPNPNLTTTVYLEKKPDANNISETENFKLAPVIKVQ